MFVCCLSTDLQKYIRSFSIKKKCVKSFFPPTDSKFKDLNREFAIKKIFKDIHCSFVLMVTVTN